MSHRNTLSALLLVVAIAACTTASAERAPAEKAKGESADPTNRQYGPATRMGNGSVRTYVQFDLGGAPTEVGVAVEEAALEGLPAAMKMAHKPSDGMEHVDSHVFDLTLPDNNKTPYKFVELDWNPGGHEPPGVYDEPHFDFHFYRIDKSIRDGIDPKLMSKEQYLAKSGNLPPKAEWVPSYAALSAPGTPVLAVPRMGTHWVDVRTPELQAMFGKPEAFRKFTTTFLHGSWDGIFIFDEPMITRSFILGRKTAALEAQRDSIIKLDEPQAYGAPGYFPGAYRVTYEASSGQYLIALTQLTQKQ